VKGASSTGSGLGLAIARDIVNLHSGRISANSAASGTTITLTLPGN
jgi:signal transduction histidine kinase